MLGAIFIGLVQNGMNLARIESYLQIVVLGVLLIFAVVADQLRAARLVAKLRRLNGGRTMALAINCDMGEGFGLYQMRR